MSAREEILSSIRARKTGSPSPPRPFHAAAPQGDLVAAFQQHTGWFHFDVRVLESMADVPAAIAEILRAKNMGPSVHLPPDAAFDAIPFGSTLEVKRDAPGPNDAAVALAPYAIAETGTLAYPARPDSPASWHFRAGLEIAVVRSANVVAQMEDALAGIKRSGLIPDTINFVTGPSRTGDIEQTLELGAHGPKALTVLIVKE
jgi:L-lactate dehydrogenase complex protein LldG